MNDTLYTDILDDLRDEEDSGTYAYESVNYLSSNTVNIFGKHTKRDELKDALVLMITKSLDTLDSAYLYVSDIIDSDTHPIEAYNKWRMEHGFTYKATNRDMMFLIDCVLNPEKEKMKRLQYRASH